ncbi:hypothetical protein SCL_0907 [Sulfuricaulis limicola]|uniref:Tetratricopeptide repeat protein n=1 Tax=Sulfuricaulis limicola TaxID=1620215 RepID=A0A1B4XEJ2_9GAMM|nr:tetratricopeptide repeat protein [Sulfuricaulis limicola]BAV33225.1 hypothetical protein SCL_0907 [Sulfuricaulis limicola]
MRPGKFFVSIIPLSLLLVLSTLVYWPGISGPWIFDDYTNLLDNSYVKIQSLNTEALYQAAYSLEAGPLQRPIAMLSFALNYYFAGSFADSTPFKLTNLAIHAINGVLLFWMLRLVFARLTKIQSGRGLYRYLTRKNVNLLAAAVALLWLVHPIQLTSVLYVVQRMTELSALFTLLGLVFYLKGRQRMVSGQSGGIGWILFGLIVWGWLGMLSKENTVLLPVFMLVFEFVLYPNERPWQGLSQKTKYAILAGAVLCSVLILLMAIHYSLPYYANRHFSMHERVLTEARVLFFYIYLILIPRIDLFGHQHDDIAISHSLFDPWTTFSSIAGIAILLFVAVVARRKQPLLSLGILWFFAGHLLESTILHLEIAHEHRNYLPSLGILFVLIHLIGHISSKLKNRKWWALVPLLGLVFAGTTYARATQWSDYKNFSRYEALHHPDSARIQASLSLLMENQGHYEQALQAMRRAWELQPFETGFRLHMHLLAANNGKRLDPEEEAITAKLLVSEPMTPSAYIAFYNITACLLTTCRSLQIPVETWTYKILTERTDITDKSFYYYILGISLIGQNRVHEAIDVLRQSYFADPKFLHPLIALGRVFIQLEQVEVAERILVELNNANQHNPHPKKIEAQELAAALDNLKKQLPPQQTSRK